MKASNGNGTFSTAAAQVSIRVAGSNPINAIVDTGSTGVAIAEALLPAGALNGRQPAAETSPPSSAPSPA